MDHLPFFAQDDAHADARTNFLFSEEKQFFAKKCRLEWMDLSPYSEERYTKLYDQYYKEAVELEITRAQKILDFYSNKEPNEN